MRRQDFIILIVLCLGITGCSDAAENPSVSFSCEAGSPADGRIVDVTGSGHNLYVSPDESSNQVLNTRATEIIGSNQYHSIDSSTSVQIQCETDSWAKINIATPDWLTHVVGWVKKAPLLGESQSGLARVFAEEDIYWDQGTSPYKNGIVKAINQIHSNNSQCAGTLDPATVAKSSTRGTPQNPVFFVTCGVGRDVQNVFFTLD